MAFVLGGISSFLLTVGTIGLIFTILALGLNLHFGYTGLLNFGHVVFFAAGAYTAALLTIPAPGPFDSYAVGLGLPVVVGVPLGILMGGVVAAVLATLVGLTSIRLESHYLAVATFALAELGHTIILNESWLTNGTFGLRGVPRPGIEALGSDLWQVAAFLAVLLLTAAVYLILERLVEAPFGRLLKGIREDETEARVLGKRTNRVKLKSFALGGGIAGVAGAAYAFYIGSVFPEQFLTIVTIFVWVQMILGGVASNKGMVAGAFILVALREGTRFLPSIEGYPLLTANLRWVVIGLLLIAVLRYRPQGAFGELGEIVAMEEGSDDA